MKAYLRTTGTIFVLITLAHLWRMQIEGARVAKDPVFLLLTVLCIALAVWAWRLLRSFPRSEEPQT